MALGTRDDGVAVDERRVATDEISPVDALADEERVVEGAILVSGVYLVEVAVEAGEHHR